MDNPTAPGGLSPRRTVIKEFTLRSLLTKSKSKNKLAVALCRTALREAVVAPSLNWQVPQGRARSTDLTAALATFPALHAQAPSPARPAGGIGWHNLLPDPHFPAPKPPLRVGLPFQRQPSDQGLPS